MRGNFKVLLLTFICISFVCSTVRAAQYTFLIDPGMEAPGKTGIYHHARFALYIDPLKTNWMAWSALDKTPTIDGELLINGGEAPARMVDGVMQVTTIDPWGLRQPTMTYFGQDAQGNPQGSQAMIYGSEELAPSVMSRTAEGEGRVLSELGSLNKAINTAGVGYYVFDMEFINVSAGDSGHGPIYLVMDVHEDYRPKPPILYASKSSWVPVGTTHGSNSPPYDGGDDRRFDGDDGDDDDEEGDGDDSGFLPPPLPPDDESLDSGFFAPTLPDDDDEPVIPEPATVVLMTLGLLGAGACGSLRGRKRS